MNDRGRPRPPLKIVSSAADVARPADTTGEPGKDIDWSILMARAQAGDAEAYRRLLDEVTPFLRSLAARRQRSPADIEDAVQDILITVHRVRITYDPMRPFGPWLVAIANRRLIDQLRRNIRRNSRETSMTAEHEIHADPRANLAEGAERHRLEAAVDRLPPGQQQAIRLLKLNELSLKEASAASGLSIAALKVATHRALKSLREALTKGSDS